MPVASVLAELRAQGKPKAVEGLARFGISSENAIGVSIPAKKEDG